MTIEELEQRMLSLKSWLMGCVLPSALILVCLLLLLRLLTRDPNILDHTSVIIGFFITYFVLIRGGHILMIRALHTELKTKFKERYAHKITMLPANFKKRNLGFTLARMKRDLMNETFKNY